MVKVVKIVMEKKQSMNRRIYFPFPNSLSLSSDLPRKSVVTDNGNYQPTPSVPAAAVSLLTQT